MTSRDVVNRVWGWINRGRTKGQRVKVGHAGTLDPIATGVLVVSVGSATRLMSAIGDLVKAYDATFELGCESVSGDIETRRQVRDDLPMPSIQTLSKASESFRGWIEQTPPTYSAIHVDGRRAYERARAGESFEMPRRNVWLGNVQVTAFEAPRMAISITCGGGTYVRSVGIDLAAKCGQVAMMTQLRRTRVGPFSLDHAVDLRDASWQHPSRERVVACLRPMHEATAHLPSVVLNGEQIRRVIDGQTLAWESIRWIPPAVDACQVPGGARVAGSAEASDHAGSTCGGDTHGKWIAMMDSAGELVGLASRDWGAKDSVSGRSENRHSVLTPRKVLRAHAQQ